MIYITSIDSPDFTISAEKDESVLGLNLGGNKNIFYLPNDVYKIFPSLIVYGAHLSSIQQISKRNFVNMSKLKGLFLQRNQIEIIENNTFDDLTSLEDLDLSKKIPFNFFNNLYYFHN